MLERLKESLESCPVVKMGDYDYFIHPITDGIPLMRPEMLEEILIEICELCDFQCDLIVGAEAMAIPLIVPLSLRTGVPYNVVRKRRYGLPGEVSVRQVTGYSCNDLYINGIERGQKVVVLDDVISTGGTLRALIKTLKEMGVEIVDVIVVVEKTDQREVLERELGVRIRSLVKVRVQEGRVKVIT
jgi:adenine phosphoribosyltransferase